MAEIEHYVDPKDKAHPRFAEAKDVILQLLPKDVQEKGETQMTQMTVGEAVAKVSARVRPLLLTTHQRTPAAEHRRQRNPRLLPRPSPTVP